MKLYIDPSGGIAGDMFSAALISAGAPEDKVISGMLAAAKKLGEAEISAIKAEDNSTKLEINFHSKHKHIKGSDAKKILGELFEEYKIKEQYIAEQIYDQAYNSGTRAAGKILQKAINEYFEIRGSNRTLKIDGLIGTNTLKAYNKVRYKRVLLALIMAHRIARYKLLAKVPTQKRFLPSWLRRVVGTIGAHI